MMNQACAQCNKQLTDDESITRIVDEFPICSAAMNADSNGLLSTLDPQTEQIN